MFPLYFKLKQPIFALTGVSSNSQKGVTTDYHHISKRINYSRNAMASQNPRISFQSALGNKLLAFQLAIPASTQIGTLPKTFCDSMTVRESVFVDEIQAVPLVHHTDTDDARSCHWVLYSPNPKNEQPIGTIRLVPSPHHPHPKAGDSFVPPGLDAPAQTSEEVFLGPLPMYGVDRATSLHDGIEPYVKLGRLCVVKEFRGAKFADVVIQAALKWAGDNPGFADKERQWKGLVCVHASEKAVTTWTRNGFVLDEGMGWWLEAGMKHVGMFCSVPVREEV